MELSNFNMTMAAFGILSIFVIQGILSSRRHSFLGLILPTLTFAFSIYIILHFKKFVGDHGFDGYETLGWYGLQLFLGNVPTAILLIIYSMFKSDKSVDVAKEYNSDEANED